MTGLTMDHFTKAWRRAKEAMGPTNLTGYKIFENKYVGDPMQMTRDRTWKERLFTWPWKPFKKIAHYTMWIENGNVILDHNNKCMYIHPVDFIKLKEGVLINEHRSVQRAGQSGVGFGPISCIGP